MTPPIQYKLLVDTGYTGNFANPIDDISAYAVGQISWQAGMMRPYDEVSDPCRLTLTLRNNTSAFSKEVVGGELLANGDFSQWSGNDPVGWTVTGESGSDPEVSQVGIASTHGGSGTGSANLYSTGSVLSISQGGIFTVGNSYVVTISISALVDSVGAVAIYNGTTQVSPLYHIAGTYTVVFNATSDSLFIQTYGACDTTVNSVSAKQCAMYRMVQKGMLIRLNAIYNGTTYTYITARISDIQMTTGTKNEPLVSITAEDPMLRLLDKSYDPEIFEPTTTVIYDRGIPITSYVETYRITTPIRRMFDSGVASWPYHRGFWILGAQGSSELGLTTYLFSNNLEGTWDAARDVYAFIGDMADRGNGIDAQTYLRDLVGMEGGGRFFFNPRTSKFDFRNRHADAVLATGTPAVTFYSDDLDDAPILNGQDLNNQITLHYSNRTVGGAGSVIWTSNTTPFLLKARQSKTLNAPYFDATDNTLRISAIDQIVPERGTDLTATLNQDGTGDNLVANITVSVDFKSNAAKITLINQSDTDAYIQLLRIRGTPIKQIDKTATSIDADSVQAYDEYPRTIEVRMLDDDDFAQSYADYVVSKFKNPIDRIDSITFNSLRNAKLTAAAVNIPHSSGNTLGALIRVTLARENHNSLYFVVGERRTITIGGDNPQDVTLILKPGGREQYWISGAAGYSELGITTILGF